MKSHRRIVRRLRRLAIAAVVVAALAPAGAAIAAPESGHSAAAHAIIGDSPADYFGNGSSTDVATPPKVGDTPADFPGVSGSPAPTAPIVLVRPERTIVQEANQALPIVLSSIALAIVLMGAAFLLVRGRVQRRHLVGSSH
jgi:hypothetical protein